MRVSRWNAPTDPVVIIGGIPGGSAEQAMTSAGQALGDLLPGLTDRETDIRRFWVLATAHRIWGRHPDLTMTYRPRSLPGMPEWVPAGYDDLPKFAPRDGVGTIEVSTLFYVLRRQRKGHNVDLDNSSRFHHPSGGQRFGGRERPH